MIAQVVDLSSAEAVVIAAALAAFGTWLAARAGSSVQRKAAAEERAAAATRLPTEAFTTARDAYEAVVALLNAEVRRLADELAAARVDLARCRRERDQLRRAVPPGAVTAMPAAGPPDHDHDPTST